MDKQRDANSNVNFILDKTKIKESALIENCPELADLCLTIYSQDVFEEAVLDQIEEALENRTQNDVAEQNVGNDCSSGTSNNVIYEESNALVRLGKATPFEVAVTKSTDATEHEPCCSRELSLSSDEELFSNKNGIIKPQFSGSDEDYQPSFGEDEASEDQFSDYLSDIELDFKEPSAKKVKLDNKIAKKRRRKSKLTDTKIIKKCMDDGSDKHYEKRLIVYKKVKLRNAADRLEITGSLDEPDDDVQLKGDLLIRSELWKKLFKYQRTGVRWLWELHRQSVGGIMGDEMGLGKTIQLIAFLGSLSHSNLPNEYFSFSGLGATLIVCPATVMHQWVKELHTWWPKFRVAILHDSGSYSGPRYRLISKIYSAKGILITSYSTLTNERETLLKYDWHYVVLDEGHKIRNPDAQVTLAVKQFRTPHRLILTGTPMQNSLKELWSVVDFVFPGRLGSLPDFIREFGIPITQGGYANATPVQVQTAYKCACVLRETISPYLLRRTKSDVKSAVNLPSKNEQVLFCRLTDVQREVYKQYLTSRECDAILKGRLEPFVGLISLRKLCNHSDLVTGGPNRLGNLDETLDPTVSYGHLKRSGKMVVVEALLKLWKEQNHRVLLFSQSRQMLNILEKFLKQQEYSYMRLDGSTAIGSRQTLVTRFNETSSIFCLLLTTRVGGLGLNLIGADRILIFDPDWNPSTDMQARERAWRIGQTRPVTVYRLLLAGTIEEKIYHRQIFKQFLTNRILKDPKQRRFFKTNDLFELFTLTDDKNVSSTETSVLFAGTGSEIQLPTIAAKFSKSDKKSKNIFDEIAAEKSGGITSLNINSSDEEDIDFVPGEKRKIEPSKIVGAEDETLNNSQTDSRTNELRELAKKLSKELFECKTETKLEKKRRKRHKKRCKVDGVSIPNLAKLSDYKPGSKDSEANRDSEKLSQQHDDYVLSNLFKKSNIHSALKHDKVVDAGDADSTLVQAEAESVARRAVKSLADSRRRCYSAYAGIPTWTGKHGSVNATPRFGKVARRKSTVSATKIKKSKSTNNSNADSLFCGSDLLQNGHVSNNSNDPVSSKDLLSFIRNKNYRISANVSDQDSENESSNVVVPTPVISKSKSLPEISESSCSKYDAILSELRNFIAFGAKVDGRAETQEILSKFGSRVALQDSAVFKTLLQKICDFSRTGSGDGVWILKAEFR